MREVYGDGERTENAVPCGTETAFRPRPRRARRMGRRGADFRYRPAGEPCPVCGEEAPAYRVETVDHCPLGCERCLTIYREGIVQL